MHLACTYGCEQGFSRLNDLLPAVVEHIKQVRAGKSVNVESPAGRVTMDAISLAIFGKTRGCMEGLAQDNKPEMEIIAQQGERSASCFMHIIESDGNPPALSFNLRQIKACCSTSSFGRNHRHVQDLICDMSCLTQSGTLYPVFTQGWLRVWFKLESLQKQGNLRLIIGTKYYNFQP